MAFNQLTYERFMNAAENEKRFLGMKCKDCGAYTFPPKAVCRECSSADCEEAVLSGRGIIQSFTVIRVPPEGFEGGYVVGLVELPEGPWIMVNIRTNEQTGMDLIGKAGTINYELSQGDKFSGGKRIVFLFFPD